MNHNRTHMFIHGNFEQANPPEALWTHHKTVTKWVKNDVSSNEHKQPSVFSFTRQWREEIPQTSEGAAGDLQITTLAYTAFMAMTMLTERLSGDWLIVLDNVLIQRF